MAVQQQLLLLELSLSHTLMTAADLYGFPRQNVACSGLNRVGVESLSDPSLVNFGAEPQWMV